jgi:hypothetical protein
MGNAHIRGSKKFALNSVFIGLMSIMGVWWGLKRHLIGESMLHHPAGFRL